MDPKILIFVVICLAASSYQADDPVTERATTTTTRASPSSVDGQAATTASGDTDDSGLSRSSTLPTISVLSGKTSSSAPSSLSGPLSSRGVSPFQVTTGKCYTALQEMLTANPGSMAPERVVLNVPSDAALSPAAFCNQKTLVTKLNTSCSNLVDVNDGESAAASFSSGLTAMFNMLCAKDSDALVVLSENGLACSSSIKTATLDCIQSLKAPSTPFVVQYPSEMIMNMLMFPSTCGSLKDAKDCIATKLKGSECLKKQQAALLAPLDPIMSVSCMSPSDATTIIPGISTTTAGSTTAGDNSTTTVSPSTAIPSTTPRSRNAAAHYQTSFFIAVLPVVLAVFIH